MCDRIVSISVFRTPSSCANTVKIHSTWLILLVRYCVRTFSFAFGAAVESGVFSRRDGRLSLLVRPGFLSAKCKFLRSDARSPVEFLCRVCERPLVWVRDAFVLAEAADAAGGVGFRAEDSPGADGRSIALGRELTAQIWSGSMAAGTSALKRQ
jgi:hypothetical protein